MFKLRVSITLPASLLGGMCLKTSNSSEGRRGDQEMEFGGFFPVLRNVGLNTESGESGVFHGTLLQCCLLLDILAPGNVN